MATNPMQRKARISFILGMLLTLLICGVIIVLLFMQIKKYKDKESEQLSQQVEVFALNTDVKSGQTITSDMYEKITVNRNMVPANATSNLDNLSIYSLQDKEGNDLYTKSSNNGTKLYIKINNEEQEVKIDDNTGNYYVGSDSNKKFIELNNVPIVAKVDMKANTIITKELIAKGDNTIANDVRRQEYNTFVLPMDLTTGDYVDIRLMLPTGQDYIVISKKEVEVPVVGGAESTDTVWLKLGEDEILTVSSAIVDAYRIMGSKLYLTKYTEAGMQKAATPTYVATSETINLIAKDPNILSKASDELNKRYNQIGNREIRENYINRAVEASGEEGESNVKTKMEESITTTQDSRRKYLESLGGVEE